VHHDERRPVEAGDRLRHRERLARPGDAEQHLVPVTARHAFAQFGDRARLVAAKVEVGHELEAVGHVGSTSSSSAERP
jgi:hypothetical protein